MKQRTLKENERAILVFLKELEERANVTNACRKSTLPRATVYYWRKKHPTFAALWDTAVDKALDKVEDAAWELATEEMSEKMIMFLLKSRRPSIYGEKSKVTVEKTFKVKW